MRRRTLLGLLLLSAPSAHAGGPAAPSRTAVARPHALVESDVVRLSDLFENAGSRGDTVLGPAPAPGRRFVVEAPQLQAIARANGLAWQPLSATQRVVVERPGRPVAREEVAELLQAELSHLGLDPEAEIDLPGFVPPMVPASAFVRLALEDARFDALTRRFAATLVVMAEGMPTLRRRLTGRGLATVPVVVATRRLAAGDVVGAEDARLVRMRAERVRPGAVQRLEDVVGRQLRRPLATGLPFVGTNLAAPAVIAKNELVTVMLHAPGLALTAQGRALEAAALGEQVPVMNLASRAVVEAEVVGPGRVRVQPGTLPLAR